MPNQPGGSTVISYLQKIRDGVVFSEGFENDNFINAEAWTTLQGVPANTSAQFKSGIKSWDNSANAQSLPVAKKVITDTNVDTATALGVEYGWVCEVWFYDDVTHTTEQGPYFKIKLVDGSFIQVGVRNSITTTNYSCNTSNTYTEDNFHDSGIARSNGWHKFQIWNQPFAFGVIYVVAIDGVGTNQLLTAAGSISKVTEIYLSANKIAGTGNSFGYFDSLNYFRNLQIKFNNNATTQYKFSIYDSSNTFLASDFNTPNAVLLPSLTTIYPANIFTEVQSVTNAGVATSGIIYRSPLLQINSGDIYNFVTVNLARKCEMPGYIPNSFRQTNQSPSGVVETLVTGLKDRMTFTIKELQGFQWVQIVRNWFQYVIDGSPFSIMTDSSFDTAIGVISATVLANNSTVTIMPNLLTNPTDAFNVNTLTNGQFANNYFYVVRNNANTQKQIVTVASKTGTTLTFNETLNFTVNNPDYVYSEYLFPFLEIDGNDLSGFVIADKNIPSYTWTQKVREYDNS